MTSTTLPKPVAPIPGNSPPVDTRQFHVRLKTERLSHNLSQDQVATAVGVSQDTISKWERGMTSPGVDELLALCDLFQVSTEYLVGRAPERHGLPSGLFIIDEDATAAADGWAYQVPRHPRVVDYAQMLKLQARMSAKGRKKKATRVNPQHPDVS